MILMFIVYLVNNFTCDTKIWFLLAALSFLIYFSQKVLYMFNNRLVGFTHREIYEGNSYTLSEDLGPFKCEDIVEVVKMVSATGGIGKIDVKKKEDSIWDCKSIPLQEFLCKTVNHKVSTFSTFNPKKYFLVLGVIFSILHIVVPSKQTAQYMVGAYILEEVVTSEAVKDLGSTAIRVAKNQLEIWGNENKELGQLIDKTLTTKK